jgi:dipeptidyl aminopeptidase/acylaminoacyl peptidase
MLRASVFEDFSDRRGMARRSPAANASRARAPILLIHARDDAIVPIEQSERMAAALERAGKEHAFIVLAGADHFLSHAPSRIAMLTHLQRFLQTHLGPGVVP